MPHSILFLFIYTEIFVMKPTGFILITLALFFVPGCTNNKAVEVEEEDGVFSYERFSARFQEATLPYQLVDTTLLNNKDTAAIHNVAFPDFIADSIKTKLFGKATKIKYIPLVKVGEDNKEKYFIIKAVSGNRKAALLVTFDEKKFGAAFPFLVPDADIKTTQTTTIDKVYSISRNVSNKATDDVITEGKNVYAYNKEAKTFTLIMTDLLDEKSIELINPIDTLSRTHKFAGDYGKDKINIVSIRDGRDEKEINFFIHFEKGEDKCSGELKGTAFFTAAKTAVYRQGGDACVLELHFTPTSVSLKEMEGCGVHRQLKCLFDGTYIKKKSSKSKTNTTSSKKK
jgi:hypothetical protein